MLKNILEQLGFEPERLKLKWFPAFEGDRFVMSIRDIIEEIEKLDPSPLRT